MIKKEERKALPTWLPEGWSQEVRPRGNGGTYTRYICPITNLKFYSKPEVFRYLQNPRKKYTKSSNQTTNGNTNNSIAKPLQCELKNVRASGEPSLRAPKESRKSMIDNKFSEINRSRKVLQYQADEKQARDSNSKLCTRGKVDKVPDCKAKKKITKGTARRIRILPEKNLLDRRIKEVHNDSVFASAGMKVPDSVHGNSTTERRIDDPNQLSGARVDQSIEKEMNKKTHEGLANKLNDKKVDNSKRLQGMDSSVLHIKEEQIKNVLKQLQGPVLLPAGYIPRFQGNLRSISDHYENVEEPFDSPFHYVLTDPRIVFTRTSPPSWIATQDNEAEISGRSLDSSS